VLQGILGFAGLAVFGVSDSGSLAYAPGYTGGLANLGNLLSTMMWVDRQGIEQSVPAPARVYREIRLSPDGKRVVSSISDVSTQRVGADLWVFDLTRHTLNRISFEDTATNPVWTPDCARLVYNSGPFASRRPLFSTMADSSTQPKLLGGTDTWLVPASISRDGLLIGSRPTTINGTSGALMVLNLKPDAAAAPAKPEPFLDARFSRDNPQFSPDGKWVAFQSNQTGANEIFVVPYPGPGGIMQISSGGGTDPRWNHNGRELFFRNGNKLMAVDVEGRATFQASTPYELFEKASPFYDVSPDGRRFLMLKPVPSGSGSASQPDGVHLIVNWFDELRRKVPLP